MPLARPQPAPPNAPSHCPPPNLAGVCHPTSPAVDEYDEAMSKDKCYVNPFVGEGRYARYLRLWLETVPSSQLMLLNFDEWTADAEATMRSVFAFLKLSAFDIAIERAHNTHMARSVHVEKEGASDLSEVTSHSVGAELSYTTHCILHEFYAPFQHDLDALLTEYSYPPLKWDTSKKGDRACPTSYRHWPARIQRRVQRARAKSLGGGQAVLDGDAGGETPGDGAGPEGDNAGDSYAGEGPGDGEGGGGASRARAASALSRHQEQPHAATPPPKRTRGAKSVTKSAGRSKRDGG